MTLTNNIMILIGLTGKKRSGKDTVAACIQTYFEKQGKSIQIEAFARPIKDILNQVFHIEDETIELDKEVPIQRWGDRSPRVLMQSIGDVLRGIDEDIFIKHMQHRIQTSNADIFIISDIRFANEADLIQRDQGGMIWCIDAGLRIGTSKDTHKTEKGIPSQYYDYTVYNNESQDKLSNEVYRILNETF
jgi:hypothetical protein